MTEGPSQFLCDPVLIKSGVVHGFGQKGSQPPESTWFSRQVHGIAVVAAGSWARAEPPMADVVLSAPDAPIVGVVTADCVPILLATPDGSRVGRSLGQLTKPSFQLRVAGNDDAVRFLRRVSVRPPCTLCLRGES